MEELKGLVFDILFRNEDNGYTVALIETEQNVITITGTFPANILNENIHAYGKYINHPKYGDQFAVETYNNVLPTEIQAIEAYLSSGLIKGIGPSLAKRIVDKFGENTLTIMQTEPNRLVEVDGIGEKKAKDIIDSFTSQLDIKDIMVFLQRHGISSNFAVKIYKEYGSDTIQIVKSNPYKLAEDIQGIGFNLADKVATSLGITRDSSYRIEAGILYTLKNAAANGHCYLPIDILIRETINLLEINEKNIEMEISNLLLNNKIHSEIINGNRCIYYIPYYMAETGVSSKLFSLSNVEYKTTYEDVISMLDENPIKNRLELTDIQKEAVAKAITNGVTIITGGPGTGKTTIIKSIIDIFTSLDKKVLLCAPTGRAAKRMTESTGVEAKTIHRMLEFSFGENDNDIRFNKNEESPLITDAIIVDEVSMIDVILMNTLLKAITVGTRLILVGDADQLPSVGAGNVLRDLIHSQTLATIKLDKIFRQSNGSAIIENAHKINHGQSPIYNETDSDFYLMQRNSNKDILNLIIDLYSKRLPSKYNYDPIKDIQVISPMKKGDAGVIELNNKLQAVINPPAKEKAEKKYGNTIFRTGDKVMQIKNNYQIEWTIKLEKGEMSGEGIFNGDIGYITFIDNANNEMIVEFDDGKEVVYPYANLDELILAYATTVHKSQGSEFPVIIMPATWAPIMLLTRNLLYTAITRAKELVVLVGQEKYINEMIRNNKVDNRYSALDLRLKAIKEMYNY